MGDGNELLQPTMTPDMGDVDAMDEFDPDFNVEHVRVGLRMPKKLKQKTVKMAWEKTKVRMKFSQAIRWVLETAVTEWEMGG